MDDARMMRYFLVTDERTDKPILGVGYKYLNIECVQWNVSVSKCDPCKYRYSYVVFPLVLYVNTESG